MATHTYQGSVGEYLDEAPVGWRHAGLLALLAGGSFFDAFDIYLSGPVLAAMLETHFSTLATNATFLSSTALGLLLGTLAAGYVGDRAGRRTSYLYSLLLYGVASVLTAFAANPTQVVVLRALTGLGLGAVLATGYGVWNEFTPRRGRARWASLLSLLVNLSQPAAAFAGFLAIPAFGWRSMFLIAGLPALLIWALQIRFLPESPRWLESQARHTEAHAIARRFNPDTPLLTHGVGNSVPDVATGGGSVMSLFRRPLLRVTVVAILISVCNQVPYFAFQSWVPTYLVHNGLTLQRSLSFSVLMQLGAIPGAILGGLLGDLVGRKWTNVALFVLLGLIGLGYGNAHTSTELIAAGFTWVLVANIAITLQIASYIPEMFPTVVRMRGSALANACGRFGVIFAPFLVTGMLSSWGVTAVFVGSLLIFLLGALAVAFLGPETRRRSLEDIAADYQHAPPSAAD